MIRALSVWVSPAPSATTSVPELKALGGQLIGSTATPTRPMLSAE